MPDSSYDESRAHADGSHERTANVEAEVRVHELLSDEDANTALHRDLLEASYAIAAGDIRSARDHLLRVESTLRDSRAALHDTAWRMEWQRLRSRLGDCADATSDHQHER